MANVKVENQGRDIITLVVDEKQKIVLGSRDDRNNLDVSVPKPEQSIPLEVWKKLEKRKAVAGMIADGSIRVFGA